jgi:hypothetical protein
MRILTSNTNKAKRHETAWTMFIAMFFVISSLVMNAPSAVAQSIVTGGLSGIVTDHSGAVVNGARLTLKSGDTGDQYRATSSASGEYSFALLKPGMYALTVEKEGFKEVRSSVTIHLGTTITLNPSLDVGGTSETIEVTGDEGLLQTEDANISTNFETQQIREVPNPGGDITYVAQTAPGVVMNSNGYGYGNFSTFGLPGTSNLFTINGNDYNDPFFNLNNSGSSNLLLGGNELQQVSVVNNAYTGQYGRQAGSQVDYATRSGSNAWHGDAVYYWTGRYLNANDPINAAGGNPRPFENNNQWADSVGGPILKNKVYFFFNNEGIRYIFGVVNHTTVPTQAFETATLANIPQDPGTQAFYNSAFSLWNSAPGIGAAQPNPSSCPAGIPLTGGLAGGACTETWSSGASSGNHEYLVSTRVDYSINDSNKLFGRVRFDRGQQPTYTDLINPAFDTFSTQPQDEGQLNYTHVFTPNIVNNFIGSVLYYSALFGNIEPGAKALQLFPGNLVFPSGQLTALGFGSGTGGFASGFPFPQGRNVTQWGLVDDLSVTRGNHSFKMGFNFKRADVSDHAAAQTAIYPAVSLSSLVDFFNDQVNSFVPGATPASQDGSSVNYNFAQHLAVPEAYYSLGMYFQDEFRAGSNLKFTLALRADRNSGGLCQIGCAGLPVNTFQDMPHGASIPYDQSFITGNHTIVPNIEKVVFQPRFGVSWSPGGKNTVIRGGVGLFSDLYPAVLTSFVDTNFPQVNLWNLSPSPNPSSLAWDMNAPASTAFPNSAVTLVQQCNSAFNSNYYGGGNLLTYQAAAPQCGNGVPDLYDVSRNLSNPKYVEWNLEIQHSIGSRTVISANYVGNRGFDELYRNSYLNGFGFGSLPSAPVDPRVGEVQQLQNGAISNYNGITLSLQQNTWHGFSGRINYTYSHALDDISNGGALPFSVYNSIYYQINPYSIRNDYASADYDGRHSLTVSYVYELPFKSGNRALNSAIGGWQLSGTLFAHTGFPFSIDNGAEAVGLASNNLYSSVLNGAQILLAPEFSKRDFSNSDVRPCINSPCFGIAPSPQYGGINAGAPYMFAGATDFTNPVAGRNAFRGPGFLGGDMSLRKNFKVTERVGFQLGLDAYNFLNHANYSAPGTNTIFGFFGSTLTTQFSPTSPYGAFALAATDMRIAQIQGKITF